jgi:hypothetical protein
MIAEKLGILFGLSYLLTQLSQTENILTLKLNTPKLGKSYTTKEPV